MSFDSKKNQYGERLASGVSLFVNACKYSIPSALDKRSITAPSISQGQTGTVSVSGGDPIFFQSSNPYLRFNQELIRIDINSATQINIIERGALGTTDVAHSAGSAEIIHGGEADGSCYGYPQLPDGEGCSTPDSFDKNAEREFLFIDSQSFDGQIYYNGLKSINHTPVKVKPGEAMAKNASVSVSIADNTDDDVYAVPYPNQRVSISTLFRKLLARHPYMQNRRLVTYTGFESNGNFSKSDCNEREYVIDDLSYQNESVTIRAIDPLMLAEESKAKMPRVSAGKLSVAIDSSSTQIQMKDFTDGEYGNDTDSITVRIDNELIDCTVNSSSTGLLDIVNRAVGGSEQKDHDVNASVQLSIVLADWNPIETIIDWLDTYTNIDTRFFDDYTTQESQVVNGTGPVYISKPDSVQKYINNVIRCWGENNIALYFSELDKKIKIKLNSDFQQQPLTLNFDTDIKQDSISIEPDYKGQITRSTIGFAPFDSAKKVDDDNSSIVFQSINALTELTGTLEPQESKDFFTQFLTNSDNDVQIAVSGTARDANLNVKPPEIYKFEIDYSNYGQTPSGKVEEAEIINVVSNEVVNPDGTPKSSNVQILSLKDNPTKSTYTVLAKTYQDIILEDDFDFVIDENKENYDLSTEFSPSSAGEYTIFIKSGVTIGSTNISIPAFTTGNQNTGVTLKIVNRGSILGKGGKGADGPLLFIPDPDDIPAPEILEPGKNGLSGGDALELTVDCIIDCSQGVIYSGGGGSPSYSSTGSNTPEITGKAGTGGSGGQGYIGGSGGSGGTVTLESGGVIDQAESGLSGSRSGPGELQGLKGGFFGESSSQNPSSGNAGLAGFAIISNGNNVNIIGDNDLTIKGRRS